jgi:hypothetical protein
VIRKTALLLIVIEFDLSFHLPIWPQGVEENLRITIGGRGLDLTIRIKIKSQDSQGNHASGARGIYCLLIWNRGCVVNLASEALAVKSGARGSGAPAPKKNRLSESHILREAFKWGERNQRCNPAKSQSRKVSKLLTLKSEQKVKPAGPTGTDAV